MLRYDHEDPDYSPREADIWALGIILMNLITGTRPWARASHDDPNFYQYVLDRDALYRSFPISRDANEIFKSIFTLHPYERRTSINELRERIIRTVSFGAGDWDRVTDLELERRLATNKESYDAGSGRGIIDMDSEILSDESGEEIYVNLPLRVVNGAYDDISSAASEFINENNIHSTFSFSYVDVDMDDTIATGPVPTTASGMSSESHLSNDDDSEGPETPETFAADALGNGFKIVMTNIGPVILENFDEIVDHNIADAPVCHDYGSSMAIDENIPCPSLPTFNANGFPNAFSMPLRFHEEKARRLRFTESSPVEALSWVLVRAFFNYIDTEN